MKIINGVYGILKLIFFKEIIHQEVNMDIVKIVHIDLIFHGKRHQLVQMDIGEHNNGGIGHIGISHLSMNHCFGNILGDLYK